MSETIINAMTYARQSREEGQRCQEELCGPRADPTPIALHSKHGTYYTPDVPPFHD